MKFRRKSAEAPVEHTDEAADQATPDPAALVQGPYDADDLPAAVAAVERVDLGSLRVAPFPGRELRLQVDERTQSVQSVLFTNPEGALELRAFAAPRGGDLWAEVRPQLEADVVQRGGTAEEREGRFGPELVCQLTIRTTEGQTGTQHSRIIGVNGPRWLLRATLLGRPAVDPAAAGEWEDAIAGLVVHRGENAMRVGDALPLVMPPGARRAG